MENHMSSGHIGVSTPQESPGGAPEGKQRCLVELCGLMPGARVLNAMCGEGGLSSYLLERNPSRLLSVDPCEEKVSRAASICTDSRAEFRCCDVMSLLGEEFDCAVVYNAYHLFENRGSLIRQMHHLLVEEGRLMICLGQSRHRVNNGEISIPLPAAKTLASTMSPYFEVDTLVDSTAIYVVSGLKKTL